MSKNKKILIAVVAAVAAIILVVLSSVITLKINNNKDDSEVVTTTQAAEDLTEKKPAEELGPQEENQDVKAEVLKKASDFAVSKDYAKAIETIKNADNGMTDKDYKESYNKYVSLYVADVIKEVDNSIKTKNYANADRLLNEAERIVPGNKEIIDKREEVNTKTPRLLADVIKPHEKKYFGFDNGVHVAGKSYDKALTFGAYCSCTGYALFNLEYKYQTLEFDVGHIDETDMEETTIIFYIDDKEVKRIDLNPTSLPVHYSVPLNNGGLLKIEKTDSFGRYALLNATIS